MTVKLTDEELQVLEQALKSTMRTKGMHDPTCRVLAAILAKITNCVADLERKK